SRASRKGGSRDVDSIGDPGVIIHHTMLRTNYNMRPQVGHFKGGVALLSYHLRGFVETSAQNQSDDQSYKRSIASAGTYGAALIDGILPALLARQHILHCTGLPDEALQLQHRQRR